MFLKTKTHVDCLLSYPYYNFNRRRGIRFISQMPVAKNASDNTNRGLHFCISPNNKYDYSMIQEP
jgi:hypothetical protein